MKWGIQAVAASALGIAFMAGSGAGAMAADLGIAKPSMAVPTSDPMWFLKVGVSGVIFNSSASIKVGGVTVPGASARAHNNVTATFEIGRYLTNNIALAFTGGYPPLAKLTGAGTAAPFGTLGKATYGPAVLTLQYHVKEWGAFQPYVGVGGVYAVILNSRDGAIRNLHVKSGVGFALQAGVDYQLSRNWVVFVDVKKLFVSVNATGILLGSATAKVKLDPTIATVGLSYRF